VPYRVQLVAGAGGGDDLLEEGGGTVGGAWDEPGLDGVVDDDLDAGALEDGREGVDDGRGEADDRTGHGPGPQGEFEGDLGRDDLDGGDLGDAGELAGILAAVG
jgi:hypothetical protein